MPDFTYYPKTPRLSSGYIITEKLDGSQAAVEMWRSRGLTCLQAAKGDF